MKRTLALLTLALILLSFFSFAQNPQGSLTGKIADTQGKPFEGATVSLLKAADSTLVKTISTDKSGQFRFDELPAGNYLIKSTAVGFQTSFQPVPVATGAVSLPELRLTATSRELNAVTVTARKPFIEQKIDRTIVNVDAAVTNVGATALEVLEKSPGVMIDKDGNISLKGKQGVMVMMDGKPTYLTGDQLTNLLKTMPASALDQIEIITNPSAKYDAAGNSGIINIKTKKNKQKGFNGSVTANYGQGYYWKTNNSFNLNYRTGKVNLFANGGYSVWNGFQTLDINRKYKDASSKALTAIFDQTSHMKNENTNYNLKLGADYYLTNKTTLGFVFNGSISPEKQTGNNTSYLMSPASVTDSIIYSASNTKDNWKNKSINLNLRHQFDSLGKELTADVDYVSYGSKSQQYFDNTTYDAQWNEKYTESLKGYLPVDISIYSAKVDYTMPLGKGGKLETGLKGSYVNTDNEANYYNLENNNWVTDYGKTNHFQYKEKIMAGYVNYNIQLKKWGIQTGLRYEHTNYTGDQFGNPTRKDSSFSRTYGNLFPTIFVSYAANDKNTFAVSLGRRIDRPAYQDLNPFMFFLDKFTYGSGNPYLQPQFTQNVELTHTYKGWLTTTLNYSHTKDLFTETFQQDGYATIVRQGNIGSRDNAGLAMSAQIPVRKWWTAILYGNYSYSVFKGQLYGEPIEVEAGNLTFNVNNQFKFNKGWSAELSGWYRTKGVEGQIVIMPMGAASAGLSKQVLKGKGSVKLNVRDIFYTQQAKGDINFQTTEAHFRNSRDSRVANISFVYRFGKPLKDARQRRNTGGAGDEQNRVKMGGNN
ncbi:outer membrane beta-barrel protein [Flavihumibacter petaseus]|nr:outer membrane beta-barrel protein [Flavihumibacter petaseus]